MCRHRLVWYGTWCCRLNSAFGSATIMTDDLNSPPPKTGHSPPQFSGHASCLLWPNGWMHQDTTWYGGRPRPRRHCVRWSTSSPLKGAQPLRPQFLAHVYCGQTSGWIKVPLGTEVGLGPGDIVLDGAPAPPERGSAPPPPNFGPSIVAK